MGFFRLEDDVLPEPLSVGGLKMNMMYPMGYYKYKRVVGRCVHQGK
jgi:hypothetical protein